MKKCTMNPVPGHKHDRKNSAALDRVSMLRNTILARLWLEKLVCGFPLPIPMASVGIQAIATDTGHKGVRETLHTHTSPRGTNKPVSNTPQTPLSTGKEARGEDWPSFFRLPTMDQVRASLQYHQNGAHNQKALLQLRNLPRDVNIPQYHDLTSTKKSNVRINDQLIPDPTKINICKKVITGTTQRHHPYQSHVSQFAMFPNFCFPVDPDTDVQAAARSHLNPLVSARIPKMTVLSKTMGAPYRHEVLEGPSNNRTHLLTRPEEQGFHQIIDGVLMIFTLLSVFNNSKSRPHEGQKFYPTAPKAMCPNKSLCPRDFTLCAQTGKLLQNLERSLWVTSYQRDFTGGGSMNPRKLDDFHERTVTGETTPYSLQLVNRDSTRTGLARGTGSTQTTGSESEHVRNILPVSSRMEYKDSPYSKKLSYALDNHSFGSIQPASATAALARVSKAEQGSRSAADQETCGQPCSSPVSPNRRLRIHHPGSKSVLQDLHDSFSKTEAHRRSRQVLHVSPLDLQDNVCKRRQHYFYGFNSYYFRN